MFWATAARPFNCWISILWRFWPRPECYDCKGQITEKVPRPKWGRVLRSSFLYFVHSWREALSRLSQAKKVMIGRGRVLNWLYIHIMQWRLRILLVEGWSWRYAAPTLKLAIVPSCCDWRQVDVWALGQQLKSISRLFVEFVELRTKQGTLPSYPSIPLKGRARKDHAMPSGSQVNDRCFTHFASRFDTD